jgi:transposase
MSVQGIEMIWDRRCAVGCEKYTAKAMLVRDIARSLQFHQRAMKKLRQQALQCIAADAQLQQRYQLLRSVPGLGEISAVQTLAELLLLPADRDVRQWVAYAGLDPREYSSGTSVRTYTRISKVGNAHAGAGAQPR